MSETNDLLKVKKRNVWFYFSHYKIGLFFQISFFIVALLVLIIPINVVIPYKGLQLDFRELFMIEFRPCYYAGQYIGSMFTGVEIFFNPFESGFRYFPLTAILYAWCNFVTYAQAKVIYVIMIFVSNLVTSVYIGKLAKSDYGLILANIYLSTTIHLMLMFAGNTSSFAAMFLILGYYMMRKHRSFISGIMFSIAILYKPLLLCVVPFLIVIKNRKIWIKNSIHQLAGAILPLLPNLLLFFVNPAIIQAFIGVNFGLPLNPSSNSISIPIGFLLNVPPGTVFWVLFISLEIFLFILYYLRKEGDELDYLKVSVMLAISTFVGSWSHYYLFYGVFAAISFSDSKHTRLKNLWIVISYITPWQIVLTAFSIFWPIESLYVINMLTSIPYMVTLVLEYKETYAKIHLPAFTVVQPSEMPVVVQQGAINSTSKSVPTVLEK